jgi:hypothetical protein
MAIVALDHRRYDDLQAILYAENVDGGTLGATGLDGVNDRLMATFDVHQVNTVHEQYDRLAILRDNVKCIYQLD